LSNKRHFIAQKSKSIVLSYTGKFVHFHIKYSRAQYTIDLNDKKSTIDPIENMQFYKHASFRISKWVEIGEVIQVDPDGGHNNQHVQVLSKNVAN